jgi:hypothetical protein
MVCASLRPQGDDLGPVLSPGRVSATRQGVIGTNAAASVGVVADTTQSLVLCSRRSSRHRA